MKERREDGAAPVWSKDRTLSQTLELQIVFFLWSDLHDPFSFTACRAVF